MCLQPFPAFCSRDLVIQWVLTDCSLCSRDAAILWVPTDSQTDVLNTLSIVLLDQLDICHSTCSRLKADRLHLREYPHKSYNYRHTDKFFRLVMNKLKLKLKTHWKTLRKFSSLTEGFWPGIFFWECRKWVVGRVHWHLDELYVK